MNKRDIYNICINPLQMFCSKEFGFNGDSLNNISELSYLLEPIRNFPQKDEMIDNLFGISNISKSKLDKIMNSEDNTKQIMCMIDVIERTQKYIYEIYDICLITINDTSEEARERFINFMKYPSKIQLGYASIIEWDLENNHVPKEIIDRFMPVISPQIKKIHSILQEFVDYDDEYEEVDIMSKKSKKTEENVEAVVDEVVIDDDIVTDEDINTRKVIEGVKFNAKPNMKVETKVVIDAKEVVELTDEVNSLDEGMKIDYDPDKIDSMHLNWKILWKIALYTLNGVKFEKDKVDGKPVKMDEEWFKNSALYTEPKKSYPINHKIFRGRFASLIINWFLKNVDEHFDRLMAKCLEDNENPNDFIKAYQKMYNEALVDVMEGKYKKLITIEDAFMHLSCDDELLELYNDGFYTLKDMRKRTRDNKSIVRMAYLLTTGKDSGIVIDNKDADPDELLKILGESVIKSGEYAELYRLFLKARPSIPTKIRNLDKNSAENWAILSLAFMQMVTASKKDLLRQFKMCV